MRRIIHERLLRRESNPFFARLPGTPPVKRYMIATTARTGSTLLCSRIAEYGGLGFPNEFLNERYIGEFDRLFPNPSLDDFERYVSQAFTSPEGVFGMKVDWWRFQEARQHDLFRAFYEPLDLVVHLRRNDFVAQAVSLELAVRSNTWHARDVEGSDTVEARHQGLAFDPAAIKEHARAILNQEFYWRRYIEQTGVRALDLSYEDVARDVDGSIQAIADAFDLRLNRRRSEPIIEKALSSVAQHWRDRFWDEYEDFVGFWLEHRGRVSAG